MASDDVEKRALLDACSKLSEDEWNDITGAMSQRDMEFCCNAREAKEGGESIERVGNVVDALRKWASLQDRS